MPISIGGLGLPPSTIGYIIGSYGFFTGLFQFFFFAKLVRGLGERRVFVNGICAFVPIFAIMPLANWIAWKHTEGEGVGQAQLPVLIWVLIGVFVVLEVVMDVAYGRRLFIILRSELF
jgi:MFS family permease